MGLSFFCKEVTIYNLDKILEEDKIKDKHRLEKELIKKYDKYRGKVDDISKSETKLYHNSTSSNGEARPLSGKDYTEVNEEAGDLPSNESR